MILVLWSYYLFLGAIFLANFFRSYDYFMADQSDYLWGYALA